MINPDLIKVRIISTKKELNIIRHHLYNDNILIQKWNFSPNNPAGIRIEKSADNKPMLVSNRDVGAKWFVAFYRSKIIGCARVCDRDMNGHLEIQPYNTKVDFMTMLDVAKYPKLVELSRGLVLPKYRKNCVSVFLLHAMFKYCEKNNLSACTGPSEKKMINLYKKVGFPSPGNHYFKWEPQDPEKALFFLADFDKGELRQVIVNLEEMMERIKICYLKEQKKQKHSFSGLELYNRVNIVDEGSNAFVVA